MSQIEDRKPVGKCRVDDNGKIMELEREYFRQGIRNTDGSGSGRVRRWAGRKDGTQQEHNPA